MRFFACGREDGCFAAPAAGRGFRASEREYLSFFVKRKVPKKTT